MSNGHTPGPWVVERADDAYCIASVGNLVVMPSSGKVKHDNTEADARLISAAPDLLEALESAQMAIMGYTHQNAVTLAALFKANAAIAKARGTTC